jgi:hypothetical protein
MADQVNRSSQSRRSWEHTCWRYQYPLSSQLSIRTMLIARLFRFDMIQASPDVCHLKALDHSSGYDQSLHLNSTRWTHTVIYWVKTSIKETIQKLIQERDAAIRAIAVHQRRQSFKVGPTRTSLKNGVDGRTRLRALRRNKIHGDEGVIFQWEYNTRSHLLPYRRRLFSISWCCNTPKRWRVQIFTLKSMKSRHNRYWWTFRYTISSRPQSVNINVVFVWMMGDNVNVVATEDSKKSAEDGRLLEDIWKCLRIPLPCWKPRWAKTEHSCDPLCRCVTGDTWCHYLRVGLGDGLHAVMIPTCPQQVELQQSTSMHHGVHLKRNGKNRSYPILARRSETQLESAGRSTGSSMDPTLPTFANRSGWSNRSTVAATALI